jgi:hypothetical protein
VALFTLYFTVGMILRPFEEDRRPRGPRGPGAPLRPNGGTR